MDPAESLPRIRVAGIDPICPIKELLKEEGLKGDCVGYRDIPRSAVELSNRRFWKLELEI